MVFGRRNCPKAISIPTKPRERVKKLRNVAIGETVWINSSWVYKDRHGRHYVWNEAWFYTEPSLLLMKVERTRCGLRVWYTESIEKPSGRTCVWWWEFLPIVEFNP